MYTTIFFSNWSQSKLLWSKLTTLRTNRELHRGSYSGIFVMRDQIISFTVKRDLKKIFFVIRDAHISRDTWRPSKQNLNIRDSSIFQPVNRDRDPPCTTLYTAIRVTLRRLAESRACDKQLTGNAPLRYGSPLILIFVWTAWWRFDSVEIQLCETH